MIFPNLLIIFKSLKNRVKIIAQTKKKWPYDSRELEMH